MDWNWLAIEAIGWIADACFLSGYFLTSTGRIAGTSKTFNSLNLVGAILFGIYAFIRWTPPVLILECFWASLAFRAIRTSIRTEREAKRMKRLAEEEAYRRGDHLLMTTHDRV